MQHRIKVKIPSGENWHYAGPMDESDQASASDEVQRASGDELVLRDLLTKTSILASNPSGMRITMKRSLFAAIALGLAIPAIASDQEALKTGSWDFMNSAADGTSYFGQVQTRLDDQIVLRVRVKGDPSIENKDYVIITAIKCREGMFKQAGDQWRKPTDDMVVKWWIEFACR